jgi:hypothetical protein
LDVGRARPLRPNACAVAPTIRRPGHHECLRSRQTLQSRVLCRHRIPRPDSPWWRRRHHFRLVAGFLRAVDRSHLRTGSKREHRRAEDPRCFAVTHWAQRHLRCRSERPADVEVAIPDASICICGHATYCAMAEPRLHLEQRHRLRTGTGRLLRRIPLHRSNANEYVVIEHAALPVKADVAAGAEQA